MKIGDDVLVDIIHGATKEPIGRQERVKIAGIKRDSETGEVLQYRVTVYTKPIRTVWCNAQYVHAIIKGER